MAKRLVVWMAERLVTVLRQLGPLRVPIVAWLALLYLPLAAIFPAVPGAALVRGLYDLRALTPHASIFWTFVTFSFAWLALAAAIIAVCQTGAMIHDLGPARLGTPAGPPWLGLPSLWPRIAVSLPAVLAVVASLRASTDGRRAETWPVAIAAAAAGVVVLLLVWGAVRIARNIEPARSWFLRLFFRGVARCTDTTGYGSAGAEPAADDPIHHHVLALLLFVLSFIVWLGVFLWALSPSIQPHVRVPALCSLYLLFMLLVWFFSAATFLFDRYRIPILTVAVVLTALFGVRDYRYDALPARSAARPLLPAEMVEVRIGKPSGRIVAIAAAGGGIQAAAWTARVLEGLVEEAGADRRDRFLERVVVLSGVSGGSVGLAPYVLALDAGRADLIETRLWRAASTSSLDRLAATWATMDMLPFSVPNNRGIALQNAWIASWESMGLATTKPLSALLERRPEAGGRLRAPGVMFNATSMTTGERLIFGTTIPTRPTLDDPSFLQSAVVETAARDSHPRVRTPEYRPVTVVPDIDVATAARLSATFPLVSPAVQCDEDCGGLDQHVVDGGYVDNSGVESLAEWLEALLSDDAMRDVSVSVVQIIPFSENDCQKKNGSRSAPSQLAVPLRTLYGVRGAGQARNTINDLVDLQREFSTKPAGRVCLHSFVFDPCRDRHGFNPPLSWHLTDGQSEDVRLTWERRGNRDEARKVVAEALGGDCVAETIEPSRARKLPAKKLPLSSGF